MSLIYEKKNAETTFRDAFVRLKNNSPQRLPKGTKLTQNNVAREAGKDPSALKKSRFPLLVIEIQEFIESLKISSPKLNSNINRQKNLKSKLLETQKQRDKLLSIVESQQNLIEDLLDQIDILELGNVTNLSKRGFVPIPSK